MLLEMQPAKTYNNHVVNLISSKAINYEPNKTNDAPIFEKNWTSTKLRLSHKINSGDIHKLLLGWFLEKYVSKW